ncbi:MULTISPECIES: ABC transporter ATP-binding protein [Rhodomicrobium]|uniref:ABC transporter ATP-binding protein n=1 Tax=Rhodomicrobium TaxID=1068 RepID=UPI000B4BD964|nr:MULTISPECIES: ABC transporter ATP-binding protein [Rhodomicrobium]
MLELIDVSKATPSDTLIRSVSMRLEKGSLNILLGPTLSGKTSLMRLMAGLDRPTSGDILVDGKSVIGVPVQKRDVAMVYQQFINYPSLTVYENIASPLRVAKLDRAEIEKRVRQAARLLKLEPYLDRTPLNLSGGQQQRTAIARAFVKRASLVLLDEPLANLDYKLREELRAELPPVFAETGSILVYATTEPSESLLLGGKTATLHEGAVTQFGPTIDVYQHPANLRTAKIFSDPPLNTIRLRKAGANFVLDGGISIPVPRKSLGLADGDYIIGFRAHHLHLDPPRDEAVQIKAKVAITEITGSESFVHVDFADARWVGLVHGVRVIKPDETIPVYLVPDRFFIFDTSGALAAGPVAQAAA